MGGRRAAREAVLQALYRLDMLNRKVAGEEIDRVVEEAISRNVKDMEYFRDVLKGVLEHMEEIDALINRISTRWKVDKMNPVERNILRIAGFELIFRADIPPRVTMNEAVLLAKKFGSEKSSSFVNGIIDRMAKELQKI